MARAKSVKRTVQYWGLVEAATGNRVDDVDWREAFRQLQEGLSGSRPQATLDGRLLKGNFHVINTNRVSDAFKFDSGDGKYCNTHLPHSTGLVIAAEKDYVPNQEEAATGNQEPLGTRGIGWHPVDNLYVWHMPFANIIGVLAESVSSSRAGAYADWLNEVLSAQGLQSSSFQWRAVPVIDPERQKALRKAEGLRSFIYAGQVGSAVAQPASAWKTLFGTDPVLKNAEGLRIEIKVSRAKGVAGPGDDQDILEWYNRVFGSLSGNVEKAQVTTAPHQGEPADEIDLLHHRLTRKRDIPLQMSESVSFIATAVLESIVDSYVIDREDLLRLRDSDAH